MLISGAAATLNACASSNRLRLNTSKTQYIWLGTHQQLTKLDLPSLAIELPSITLSSAVRDLGIILDHKLSFSKHVHELTRVCYCQLRQLRVASRSLSSSAATTLVHAFIANRLDYRRFVGLPQVRLSCLERILRSPTRLVGGVFRFGHVFEFMSDVLHMLPVWYRILYRFSSTAWYCVLERAPAYLSELFILTSTCMGAPFSALSVSGDFVVPYAPSAIAQRRAFSVVVLPSGMISPLDVVPSLGISRVLLMAFFSIGPGSRAILSRLLLGALYLFIIDRWIGR